MRLVFFLLFILALSHLVRAQDEIILKQTGKPLDFELRIIEVNKDTIRYKAFGKIKAIPTAEVKAYRAGSIKVNTQGQPVVGSYVYKEPSKFQKDSINALKENCITVGILQGGGSLIGLDYELKPAPEIVGLQAGVGFTGFDFAVNVHVKRNIMSSFLSLCFFHQGIGNSYIQSGIGPNLVLRTRFGLTAQLGVSKLVQVSQLGIENVYSNNTPPPFILFYSAGWCHSF